MADESLAAATAAEANPKSKSKLVPIIVIGMLMAGEGIGVYFLANFLSPPPAGALGADDGDEGIGIAGEGTAELDLVECRATNSISGRRMDVFIRVAVIVKDDDLERATELRDSHKSRIEHSVNVTIRGADPKHFEEPELQTLRRRIKAELAEIFDDEQLVRQVLIPNVMAQGGGV